MTDQTNTPNDTTVTDAPRRKRGPLGRLGCALGLVFWFLLILSPCAIFMLATRGELTLDLGSAPEQTARVWLVMEEDERGIGLSLPTVQTSTDGLTICVQTDVRYALWDGEAEPISYCSCYTRPATEAAWQSSQTTEGVCTPSSLDEAAQP